VQEIFIPVTIGGVTFKNPFYVASGPTTKSVRQLKRIEECGWAAASIKLTIDPAPYINRKPRYGVFRDRNALAFTTEKRLTFAEGLQLVEEAKQVLADLKLMANITYAGDQGAEGWVNMAKRFEEVGADIIELNMCCPNMSYNVELTSGGSCSTSKKTGASLGQSGDAVAEIVRAIKREIHIPLFVKLTPEGGQIARVAKALYEAGADAVGGTSNRLGIPPIDLENPGKAVYHLQDEISMSCHCGAWLKPLAQRDTYEIRKVNGMERKIMMAGGVRNWRDAVELIMCGANLVGVCAETLISGYDIARPMIEGLKRYMDEHGYKDPSEFCGVIVPGVKTATEVTLYKGYAHIVQPNLAAPCKYACPHHVPAQAYIQKVAKREFEDAYRLITGKGPMQEICGLVCSHPCEEVCTRGIRARALDIRGIKRFVLDYGRARGWKPSYASSEPNGHRVAVIGSGPAGIACAGKLAEAGYAVTMFEKDEKPGGMLRYGIPRFRLPESEVDRLFETLAASGVRIETGRRFGRDGDLSIESLKEAGFEAVFLGIGAGKGNVPNIEGVGSEGVLDAMEFVRQASEGRAPDMRGRTVVLGGGFTAIDAARTAVRLGSSEVIVAYRRTRQEMLAADEEIDEAEAEGVKIMYLVSPRAVEARSGKVVGVKLSNQVLGDADASHRRAPEGIAGAEFTLPCDHLVLALGQRADEDGMDGLACENGKLLVDEATGATSEPGVFSGGDAVRVNNIITATAEGNRAAVSIDRYVRGEKATLAYDEACAVVDVDDVLRRAGYFKDEGHGVSTEVERPESRKTHFGTYTRAYTEEEAVQEASRCLNCGCGEGCQLCKTICCDFAPDVANPDTMAIDREACVACGMCFNLCPNRNIEMVNTGEKI
jgi:NADPH-dependent glutamate synthase beta subunit-like oxidoreductase/dihydroorotate dehydrogenase